jgi:transcriptional regulator GlxA family with amidase domain
MNRRELLAASAVAFAAAPAIAADAGALPRREKVRVAFMLGLGANVIDTAGPWETFQDVMLMEGSNMNHPFSLMTVGPTMSPVAMTGGLIVQPHYSIDNAPQPNVIVVPAHGGTDATRAWIKAAGEKADVVMSVCTGAFQLARAGMLDGMPATTHHEYFDDFARQFPKVSLQRGPRFVDNGRIATAGGLTSGIDLALHVVGRYYGKPIADQTARYMEHVRDTQFRA